MRGMTIGTLAVIAAGLGACDEGQHVSKVDQLMSAATKPSVAPLPSAPDVPTWTRMPSITVDNLGPYIGGRRANLQEKTGRILLEKLVAALPIEDKEVTVIAAANARIADVGEVLRLLGDAGAPSVVVKTNGGRGLAPQLTLVPESRIHKPKPCSVVVTTTKNASTGVWTFRGGGGKRARKGLAGVDLTKTEQFIGRALKRCKASTAFFSAAHSFTWKYAYNMGALIRKVDDAGKKKIDTLVFLRGEPVAGRAVKLEP